MPLVANYPWNRGIGYLNQGQRLSGVCTEGRTPTAHSALASSRRICRVIRSNNKNNNNYYYYYYIKFTGHSNSLSFHIQTSHIHLYAYWLASAPATAMLTRGFAVGDATTDEAYYRACLSMQKWWLIVNNMSLTCGIRWHNRSCQLWTNRAYVNLIRSTACDCRLNLDKVEFMAFFNHYGVFIIVTLNMNPWKSCTMLMVYHRCRQLQGHPCTFNHSAHSHSTIFTATIIIICTCVPLNCRQIYCTKPFFFR